MFLDGPQIFDAMPFKRRPGIAAGVCFPGRFADDEISVPEGSLVAELRAFYAEWRSELMKLTEG